MSGALLLALGFINPALLGGLGLAGVPILIHLLSRRFHRRVEWAAMRLLREAERKMRRRVRFEQWLLLALRCLAMALLALIFARPFLEPGWVSALLGGGEAMQRIVVLDDSASLAYRGGAAPQFDEMKAAAGRLIAWLRREAPQDRLTLFVTSRPTEPLVDQTPLQALPFAGLPPELENHAVIPVPARPRRVLETAAQRLGGAAGAVYLLSDFQRSDWLPSSAEADSVFVPFRAAADAGAASRRPPRIVLIGAGSARRENTALTSIAFERPQTLAGVPAVVHAQVTQFGARPAESLLITPRIGDAALPATPVNRLEPGEAQDVKFEVTFPEAGYHELTLALGAADAFALDDERRLTVRVKPALRVLLVNGSPSTDPQADEIFLLRNALAPAGPLSSGIVVETSEPEGLPAVDFATYDVIFLCNLAPPPAYVLDAILAYVHAGGGLAITLGDQVGDAGVYNAAFYRSGDGLLPLPLDVLLEHPRPGVPLHREEAHPVTAMFAGAGEGDAAAARFWRYWSSGASPDEAALLPADPAATATPIEASLAASEILARYADAGRTPAFIETQRGAGRVILFTSSIDLDWNNWARSVDGGFVVTLLELTQHLARRDDHPPALLAGEPLEISIRPEEYLPEATVRPPDFPQTPALALTPAGAAGPEHGLTLRGPALRHIGTYELELVSHTDIAESRPLSVNLDPAESDLTAATPAELSRALGDLPHEFIAADEQFLADADRPRRELWPLLVLALLGTLIAEQTLAWWFGQPRGVARER